MENKKAEHKLYLAIPGGVIEDDLFSFDELGDGIAVLSGARLTIVMTPPGNIFVNFLDVEPTAAEADENGELDIDISIARHFATANVNTVFPFVDDKDGAEAFSKRIKVIKNDTDLSELS